jgi:hypothetical protein
VIAADAKFSRRQEEAKNSINFERNVFLNNFEISTTFNFLKTGTFWLKKVFFSSWFNPELGCL